MQLEHEFTVPAPIGTTWDTFMDLQGVAECFPGATVTRVDGDSFDGSCKVKLGPIALVYNGTGTFVERDEVAHRAVIEAKGKDKRGNGTAGATATIELSAQGDSTTVRVVTDLKVTGKPAQFGRGVMQDVSDKLLGQFVACLEQRLGPGSTAAAAATAPSSDTPGAPEQPSAGPDTPAPGPAQGSGSGRGQASASDTLDLGSAVLPSIAKSYAPYAVAGVVGLLIGLLLGRRRRSVG
ncbi:SRPBCC family protein [Leekyejoonella antrihumi]|uniref:Carbon monoxide dehydrogenase n=1 Tax=Leekyejoonella antrihumi TaxID=1660198 RepID=A0A563E3I2_9MICO|nr:SRPBCC family protein [Leekyejoonella antrihumi]TWP36782.1 carbon monoxide dehydrogenase [Leekyejoonella antrihumi]